jgi:alpha-mannosidase
LQYGDFRPRAIRIEEGPLKTKIIFESEYYCLTWPYRMKHKFQPKIYRYKVMDIVKEVSVFRNLPRVEFHTHVDNRYPCIRLRVKFDTEIERKFYFRETQFGVVAEPTEYYTRTRGARPAGIPHFMTWFDYGNGARGITFMNRGIPASEIVKSSVYLTLFRSVYGLSADGVAGPLVPTPDALELKSHAFEYALQPHPGTWRQAGVYRWAQEYHHLPLSRATEHEGGELPPVFSFLELSPDNLILSALKKAEEGDEVILRFFETRGEVTRARIKFFRPVKEAWLADLLEREEEPLAGTGDVLEMEVKPFEIVTLKLKF